ncbi:MAG: cobalamin-binding protein [Saccharofermentanales bacterium]|jgi:hypothetical protein
MMRTSEFNNIYGLIKPANDAHTLGLQSAAEHLEECGFPVVIADSNIQAALADYRDASAREIIIDWILENQITRLGISYRLDQADGVRLLGYLYEEVKRWRLLDFQGGSIDLIFFAGLPETCAAIAKEINGPLVCFQGGESVRETLALMKVPPELIPQYLLDTSQYDETLLQFGQSLIERGEYSKEQSNVKWEYPEYGTRRDTVLKRLAAVSTSASAARPLIRAHAGPYISGQNRQEAVHLCAAWAEQLATAGLLDILSLGTSQLSQSHFGENWAGLANGGGVPVNSVSDLALIYQAAQPMLMRTYAGTKRIPYLAKLYEETINICWHALSLWWFNQLDGRGPYDLYTNLSEHIKTIRWIANSGKPLEANVSHHFSFRGADDITYITAGYLAAKLAKHLGCKTFILQNMLNTPRSTWGVQDLAKSRTLLKLVKSLEDNQFRIILQPRAGLDYFRPDPEEAKIQLAAVTCLMDDIEPHNALSPRIIHVVSYSEALHLATPEIINDSIRITLHALKHYRAARRQGLIDDMSQHTDVIKREQSLTEDAAALIQGLEQAIPDLYSADGLYKAFVAGFLPVPYLWNKDSEFSHARQLKTKLIKGATVVVTEDGKPMTITNRIAWATDNLPDAEYYLKQYHIAKI